jgi:uncharacterized membrane protein YeiH
VEVREMSPKKIGRGRLRRYLEELRLPIALFFVIPFLTVIFGESIAKVQDNQDSLFIWAFACVGSLAFLNAVLTASPASHLFPLKTLGPIPLFFVAMVFGLLVGYGGGASADLYCQRKPVVLQNFPLAVMLVWIATACAWFFRGIDQADQPVRTVIVLDFFAVAFFGALGAGRPLDPTCHPILGVPLVASQLVTAFMTAVGGGIVAAILLKRFPGALFTTYGLAAIVGGGIRIALTSLGVATEASIAVATVVAGCFAYLTENWSLLRRRSDNK